MRTLMLGLCACWLATTPIPAAAQEGDSGEIIVTAMRRLNPDDDEDTSAKAAEAVPAPVQMLRRTADFAVQ